MQHTATYSPEDNKLRLYPACRLSTEDYNRMKANGFKWAPKQELFVAPMWTPSREDLLIEMCGEIGDEDTSLVERAEQRAERFSEYSSKRADDAVRASAAVEAITEHIPFGQPILVGHHSERHARKDAQRIQNGIRKTVQMWKTASYWTERATGALAHAKYKELPGVRMRRIKGLEADMRKHQRNVKEAEDYLAAWEKCSQIEDSEKQLKMARIIAGGRCGLTLRRKEGDDPTWTSRCTPYDVLREEPSRFFVPRTLDEIFEAAREAYPLSIAHQTRWIEHYENRLSYERAMLGDFKAPEKKKRALPPLTNVNCAGCHAMTSAEWKKIHTDYKGTREEKASGDYGAYRYRVAMIFKDGRSELRRVFISDEKEKFVPKLTTDAPPPSAVPVPRFQPRHDTEEVKAQSVSELVQTRNVYAEARAAVPCDPRIPSYSDLHNMEKSAKAGVQVVVAPQLFPTPPELAARMVDEADIRPGHRVLEPSAGTGNILAALPPVRPNGQVVAVEISSSLVYKLESHADEIVCGDFLQQNGNLGKFDRVLMNPPFSNAQDIAHIKHAIHFLKPGGRLVAICAGGPRQERELLPLVEASGGIWEPLPAGTFKESGTNVNTVLLTIEA